MTTHDIRELLQPFGLMRNLEPAQLDVVAGCGQNTHFDARTMIFRDGEPADTFYALRSGKVALEINVPQRGPLVIDTLGPGDVLGWSWLFPPYRWHFDARAVESTSAVALDGKCLRDKCSDDPVLGYRLMRSFTQVVIDRLQATRLQLLDVYGHG